MSASIDVTPGVYEKFKNCKYNSAFREKSDADLLEYFLDCFKSIGCLVKLSIRNRLLSNNEAQNTPTVPTVVPSHQEGPATQNVHRFRKITHSSGLGTSSSSGCIEVSGICTPTDFYSNNPIPEEDGLPPLRRSTRSSSKLPKKSSKEPSRRMSTQNTVSFSRPPPLAISSVIKSEPIDVNDVVVSSRAGVASATFGTITEFTLTTPSEETEEDELKPSALQLRELDTNELQPSEIGALYLKRNADTVSTDSTIHPPYNPNIPTASTIHPSNNPSVNSDSTINSPDNPSVSTDSAIHPSDSPSVSTASTGDSCYETVHLPTDLTTANRGGKYHCSNGYKRRNTNPAKAKRFKCETCGKLFSLKQHLKNHIRCVHEKIKQFPCPHCHYRSNINQHMTIHLATHSGVKNYKCSHCNYAAVQQSHLTIHINERHTYKTYRCRYIKCGVKKTSQDELYEHIRSDHPVQRYLCDTCPMSFNTSQNLKVHKVSHNKDSRAYQCKYCEKRFGRSCNLARHYRTHTGDKPYECEVCAKKFNRISHLNRHKLTHTGEKRFSCSYCDKKFSLSSNKSRHEMTCKYN